ncbi:MAG TPA: HAMP domain-containing sensor histidine kinase [Gemmatimonadales bacterium]|nr:HAMP domain-containing sensor histidine kinase [Gemmatimonadales bacterium]
MTSHPRRRLIALATLLLLSLSLGAGLAVQSVTTSSRHRATAERALEDYAGFGAFILASRSYRQLGGDVVATMTNWTPGTAPAVPAGVTCPGGSSWFDALPAGSAPRFAGVPVADTELRRLRDTLAFAMPLLKEVGWRFRFLRLPGARTNGWFITSYATPSGQYGLHGFSGCIAGEAGIFRQMMKYERVLPPALTGDLPPDSLFSVSVTSSAAAPLVISPLMRESPYRGTARLGTEFGDLTVRLDLRPEVAERLVIGGIPRSPTPLAVGLMALSTLLVVTALFQLRREYELIGIRSEFVSSVSHELRTPLSQILIFTELLRLGRLRTRADRDRSLQLIEQETRRLIRLVENVLQFTGRRGARRQLAREPLPLDRVVQETVEAFAPLAAAREATVESRVPADTEVTGDPSALRQILLNLLDNAVKYGPRGQRIRVAAARNNGSVRLMVEDQGPGIPAEDRERVWEGYYRLQRETRAGVAGSGIGLAVVRSLTTDMQGRTWIEDGEEGGARFVVELAATGGEAS